MKIATSYIIKSTTVAEKLLKQNCTAGENTQQSNKKYNSG